MNGRNVAAILLGVAVALAPGSFAWSGPSPTAPTVGGEHAELHVVPSDAGRLYLAQALASLGRAEQLALQASQVGDVGDLDLERFLSELRTISRALQRVLIPDAAEPGVHLPIEITGQYLYDGLSRRRPPTEPSARPRKESQP